jgi:pimeloyl-ACP methyl ester carboxylesterase
LLPNKIEWAFALCACLLSGLFSSAQPISILDSFRLYSNVKITVDKPFKFKTGRETIVIFYALPNGNSTAWTMGKKMTPGDDWHFDIQHIRAQTEFIRHTDKKRNYVVVYLENEGKSWPGWKQKHQDHKTLIAGMIDSLAGTFPGKKVSVHLNGHSGGGSLVFGYLAAHSTLPGNIKRISFIDSNYGYESSYFPGLVKWLQYKGKRILNVFAYNDSIALLNGKPFVSATGGTWYRSHLMLKHFQGQFPFMKRETDSLIIFKNYGENVRFYFKKNLNRGIYHTQQVELNGFIHSVLAGTKFEERGYRYYGKRAYERFIR